MTIVVQRSVWTKMHFFVFEMFTFGSSQKVQNFDSRRHPNNWQPCLQIRVAHSKLTATVTKQNTETNYQYDFAVKLWSSKPLKT